MSRFVLMLGLLLAGGGCQTNGVRTELFFGLSTSNHESIPDSAWDAFLSNHIAPRFPGGLTVLHADGLWINANNTTGSERSRLVIILHPPGQRAEFDQKIEAVTSEYLKEFHQTWVLRDDARVATNAYINR
jgi:hypothetical protein